MGRKNRPGYVFVIVLASTVLATGCGPRPSEDPTLDDPSVAQEPNVTDPEAEQGSDETDEDSPALYTVRAEVMELPDPENSESSFQVHHEAIDDLVGIGGDVWGMDAMEMAFSVADNVALTDLAVGDKIEFTLAVDWFGPVPQQITAIEKLPADTELEFRPAKPSE